MIKALLDYTLALAALVVLSPLLLLIFILVKLDGKGPAVFRQKRYGQYGKVIRVWKFRTLRVIEEDGEFVQVVPNDQRVTRLGAFLRKSGLDELPQLLNVLSGDMSLVGPRPHPLALDERYFGKLENYERRLDIKPGITGWAQINGHRGPTSEPGQMEKRLQYDLDYIRRRSLLFDLKIMAKTPFCSWFDNNAI